MPKRTDIQKILIIGSGPIVIGQACEFDYSGTQACKALKEEGYQIILVNSNPATIMTDPTLANRTYIEPLTPEILTQIIKKEKPDAVLPTLGGQTGLNLALTLAKMGVFSQYNVQMLGANEEVIAKAEDRSIFKEAMKKIGLRVPTSAIAYSLKEARQKAQEIGYPCVVRPAFTLGGTGGGIVHNEDELNHIASSGLQNSLISEILIEESIYGWKEFELEVMRDRKDNVVIICSIENLDPMGVHTGDSITVAPAQTLTNKEYQLMRDAAIAIIREIGVETGGSNVQFAVNPVNGDMVIIEINPRVSRSSALASKATGFPIAKFAAKLAVGYTLDELLNDITKKTPACFEPTIDYCVVKIPRFNFKKFPKTKPYLGTSMKAVGEIMSIGRTFKEALQKGIRSLEINRYGLGWDDKERVDINQEELQTYLKNPNPWRLYYIQHALKHNQHTLAEIQQMTQIDSWFLTQIDQIVKWGAKITLTQDSIRKAKEYGFSDYQLAKILNMKNENEVREWRKLNRILPTYGLVDTCAAEFEAKTPYYYSTYETESESRVSSSKPKVMILGGGPNRIGQGIEFDYCCVHASFAIREEGYESIMVNSNPETVSTDFDISDKLYFEPLTLEDVLNIYETETPHGVIVQFGGQTPLNLTKRLVQAGVHILGTSYESIDIAEDREKFQKILLKLQLRQPQNGTATSIAGAIQIANNIEYPVVVRPSYVLGGASMEIVYTQAELERYVSQAQDVSPDHPILIDKYLIDAKEIDVDAISDGKKCVIAGIMQHIEQAGIHSGDSACSLPPFSLSASLVEEIKTATYQLAKALNVIGLMNIQFAIKSDILYVLEVNPRASRTIPFVSKATGIPWAKMATKIMLGKTIDDLKLHERSLPYFSVKEAILPFNRFDGIDILLGPEMKSTGESMGIDMTFPMAFLKAQMAVGQRLPKKGAVFLSIGDKDKGPELVTCARKLIELGFKLLATTGTSNFLKQHQISSENVKKISEGTKTILNSIQSDKVQLAFITVSGTNPPLEEIQVRQHILSKKIPYVTTLSGIQATTEAIEAYIQSPIEIKALQDYISN